MKLLTTKTRWASLYASLLLASLSVHAEITVIKAGHLIDPDRGTQLSNAFISIEGQKIIAVGIQPPEAPATLIDLSDCWVLPGLMDLHTHLTFNYGAVTDSYLADSTAYRALVGVRNGQLLLKAGFTTVRDVGNAANYADTDLRRAFASGLFDGPSIFNAGKIIAPFGGQADLVSPDAGATWTFEYSDADGVEEVRKAVRRNIFYGAKVIKMVNDARANHGTYTEEELRVAADEAHRAGLTLAVHAKDDATAIPAIQAGADTIEHGYSLSDEALRLMKAKGVFLVGTDAPLRGPGPFSDNQRQRVAMKIDRLRRAYRIGVALAFGTDTTHDLPNQDRAQSQFDYLQMWTQAGIPNSYVLKAMTVNGAQALHIAHQRGRIAAGLFADIVAVPADPLEDIQALRQINFVMKDGKVIHPRS